MTPFDSEIDRRPDRDGGIRTAFWAVTASFGAYFCMYAFRRPFTAASYPGEFVGIDFKTLLVTLQVIGYATAKFIGIKVISETTWSRRVPRLLGLIVAAEGALLLFAVLPSPWNALGLFLNGLSLGMVFGMVLGFLEGRRVTEALAAGLCASFILADGVMKSVGAWLLEWGVPTVWMPCAAGLIFLPPFFLFAAMLARIPVPSKADEAARAPRFTMNADDRLGFLRRYGLGVGGIVTMYLLITILRSFRADFQPELFRDLGQTITADVFTRTELVVTLGVLVVNGLGSAIRNNRAAFLTALATCAAGLAMISLALVGWRLAWFSGVTFMILVGLGIYLPYVAVHTTLLERMLAITRDRGNLGFLMYLADAVGYVGYAGIMVLRGLSAVHDDALAFFSWMGGICVLLSMGAIVAVWKYFAATPAVSRSLLAEESV